MPSLLPLFATTNAIANRFSHFGKKKQTPQNVRNGPNCENRRRQQHNHVQSLKETPVRAIVEFAPLF